MHELLRISRKEMGAFFGSPVAWLFLGAFLAVTLFVFFWVETFFARNIADVRPLFQWMPVLLVFLVAALTMRLWSEERRAGTLEMLLTLPVAPWQLVLGKFLACLGLVGTALLLTLPLPLLVALLGPLDWGPVAGGYVAALFLAAAYTAIGLYVSARTDNAIVALIGTALVCCLVYLLGSNALTDLFGNRAGELLKLLGSGSRFESITRGVIDLRDLYYYLSLVGVFLALNVFTLERLRWAADRRGGHHRQWRLATGLLAANFVAANLWLQPIGWARADLTAGQIYSISDATRGYLAQLQEPLLIRGYFSAQTHPLLAPLVPEVRDLLKEYEVAGGGKVRVEFVDPLEQPELEQEAGEKYGIKPVAFQTTSKYQAAVVNSYFDVLIQYGDQYEKLGFRDLIEVKARGETDLDVRLRNPEYDITRGIKKVLYGYRGGGDLFAGLTKPVTFKGFVSARARLPQPLDTLSDDLRAVLDDMKKKAGDKLTVDLQDPQANGGALATAIDEKYGFKPMAASLLDPNTFYFYMVLERGDQVVPVPLPEGLDKAGLERAVEAGLKRFTPGFLKTVALYAPQAQGLAAGVEQYSQLEETLGENAVVKKTDLKSGKVPEEADLLLVVAPHALDDKQLFAIDQFLMQGGTVLLAAAPFDIDLGGRAIAARKQPTGLEAWLGGHGLTLAEELVLDPQNTPFPIPVQRRIGGFVVQEIRSVAYPYFADVRHDGMDATSGIASGVEQVTVNWASPIRIDDKNNEGRAVIRLLQSSEHAWTSPSAAIQPDFTAYGQFGFPSGKAQGRQVLAAVVEGRFDSGFAGRQSPLLKAKEEAGKPEGEGAAEEEPGEEPGFAGIIDKSPDTARLVLFGSASFLADAALDLASGATQTRYTNPVQLVQNAIDWSLEDRALLSIRGRSHFARMLEPMERDTQALWEYLSYALVLGGLALVWAVQRRARNRRLDHFRSVLAGA